jgi:sodium transport system permease protein
MRWPIVWTIFRREVRDQVRDRRTLFMIFVLPILLYPILGIGAVQFYLAFEEKPQEVVILGAENLPPSPPLLNSTRDGFDPDLLAGLGFVGKLQVRVEKNVPPWNDPKLRKISIQRGLADAVLEIPPQVAAQLEKDRSAQIPIDYVSTDERSQLTYLRVREILTRWNEKIVQGRLARENKTTDDLEAVRTTGTDLATRAETGGSVWGKIFPFLLVIMSLTGAFYPAVDLCAGEKERGTMETLLISPASRGEIVMGKFFTIVLASMMTAVLNLLSMALTGLQLASKFASSSGAPSAALAPPTLTAAFWMALLLIPLSVFFSAICLSLAALAKSMKEGQYYMTPLYMISLPLILVTLAPGVQLNLFYSMVPITGVALLLKALIQGEYHTAIRYAIPVLLPMAIYGLVALRWAVSQFHREDVLFRESERFDVAAWMRHLVRYRGPRPTPVQALLCFTIMLSLAWFAMQAIGDLVSPLVGMGLGHLIFILLPPVVMAFLLTSDPLGTLRIRWPRLSYVWVAIALAFALNPLVRQLSVAAEWLFPPPPQVAETVGKMFAAIPNIWVAFLLLAFVPAVTEEVAFRGFILSGLRNGQKTSTAILTSALLFGFLHVLISLFSQFFTATLLGLLLGLIAVRSRSLLPGVIFHFINNGLGVLFAFWTAGVPEGRSTWIFSDAKHGLFHWPIVAAGVVLAAWLIYRLLKSPEVKPSDPFAELPPVETETVASV